MKKGMIEIVGSKLSDQIRQRGLTYAEVSREIGYADGFINNCISRNQINNSAMKMLNMIYHIQPDDYKIIEEPEPVPEEEKVAFTADLVVDYQMLFKVIYKAVYEAIKKAGSENDE